MLSSGMFARHQTLAPARRPPARRGGPARPCASSVLSATSALSVFLPALLTIRPRMVTLRSAATKGRSTFIRAKLHPLFSYACALFHFPYTTFFPPSSLPSIPSALFPKTRGVGINSSQSGTRHTALILLQLIQVLSFHTLAHSFVQWAQHNPFGINRFRTLSIAMGVWGEGASLGLSYQSFSPALSWNRVLMPQSPCFAFRFSNAVSRRFPEPFGPSIRISCQVRFVPGSVGVAHQKEASSNVQASLEAFPRSCSSHGRAAAFCAFTHRRPDGQVLRFRPLDSRPHRQSRVQGRDGPRQRSGRARRKSPPHHQP